MSTIPEVTRPAFMDSRTCRALSAACLGEAAAHRLYLAAACAMEDAKREGVNIIALGCKVEKDSLEICENIPINLDI